MLFFCGNPQIFNSLFGVFAFLCIKNSLNRKNTAGSYVSDSDLISPFRLAYIYMQASAAKCNQSP